MMDIISVGSRVHQPFWRCFPNYGGSLPSHVPADVLGEPRSGYSNEDASCKNPFFMVLDFLVTHV